MTSYEILTATPLGTPGIPLDQVIRCVYARTVNNIGEMTLTLPDIYPSGIFQRDTRIYVQRSVAGKPLVVDLETCWLVQDIAKTLNSEGLATLTLRCVDTIAILSYYIVPYNANNTAVPGSLKLQAMDDMMKAIVRENMGSLASDTTRNLGGYLAVQADSTQAPVLKKEFSKRVVLDVLREIAEASFESGTYLAFDIVLTNPSTGQLEFRTYVQQRGEDHRFPGGSPPLVLDTETDILADVSSDEKHADEKTYVYVGGQGLGNIRPVVTASDPVRIGASAFGRREIFVDDNNTDDVTVLQTDADLALKKHNVIREITATLNDQATVIRGIDWDYGDFLTASYAGQTFDVHADKIAVTLTEAGEDKTSVVLKSEE